MIFQFPSKTDKPNQKIFLESLTGSIETITYDLTGPFIHFSLGRALSQISVEARVVGTQHEMTVRFHIGLHLSSVREPNPTLTLRPAELEDELDGGASSIDKIAPLYHLEYKARLGVNKFITSAILDQNPFIVDQLKNVMSDRST